MIGNARHAKTLDTARAQTRSRRVDVAVTRPLKLALHRASAVRCTLTRLEEESAAMSDVSFLAEPQPDEPQPVLDVPVVDMTAPAKPAGISAGASTPVVFRVEAPPAEGRHETRSSRQRAIPSALAAARRAGARFECGDRSCRDSGSCGQGSGAGDRRAARQARRHQVRSGLGFTTRCRGGHCRRSRRSRPGTECEHIACRVRDSRRLRRADIAAVSAASQRAGSRRSRARAGTPAARRDARQSAP